jgi:cell division initiation protein
MIDLTPLEVRKKKGDFRRQMRGYDPELVDDFLDLVADRLEQVVRDNLTNNERLSMLEKQVADYRDREKALTEALVTAQEMREEIRKQVAREAELSRRESEQHSETIRNAALLAREREEDAIRRLRARQTQLVETYRSFLERELAELAVMAETLEVARSRPVFDEQAPAQPERAKPTRAPAKPTTAAPPQPPAAAAEPTPTAPVAAPSTAPEGKRTKPAVPPKDDDADNAWVSTLIERKS